MVQTALRVSHQTPTYPFKGPTNKLPHSYSADVRRGVHLLTSSSWSRLLMSSSTLTSVTETEASPPLSFFPPLSFSSPLSFFSPLYAPGTFSFTFPGCASASNASSYSMKLLGSCRIPTVNVLICAYVNGACRTLIEESNFYIASLTRLLNPSAPTTRSTVSRLLYPPPASPSTPVLVKTATCWSCSSKP